MHHQEHHEYQQVGGGVHGMSYAAADAPVEERAKFIERTYIHLAGAIATFVALEAVFLNTEAGVKFGISMMQNWWLVLILFIGAGMAAGRFARANYSPAVQYAALFGYVLIEAIIFIPMLLIANAMAIETGESIILPAGVSTMAVFAALTGFVMFTKRDFSWMRGALLMVTLGSVGLIFASMIFGFQLGIVFTVAMIVLAACYILYETSNILLHYPTNSHVAAALELFSSVALLFWYVLRLFMSRD